MIKKKIKINIAVILFVLSCVNNVNAKNRFELTNKSLEWKIKYRGTYGKSGH